MIISPLLKKVSISTASLAVVILGLSTGSQAADIKVTAKTQGIDSGFNSVSGDIDALLETAVGFPGLEDLLDSDLPDLTGLVGDNDFFSVSFDEGPKDLFIKSVTFDLTETLLGVSNAQFDPADADIDSLGLTIFDSFPGIGELVGLAADDITFGDVQERDTVFDISFAPDAFGVGDSLTFGVDTNDVGSDFVPVLTLLDPLLSSPISGFNDTGADFGEAGVSFFVEFWDDQQKEAIFAQTGEFESTATIGVSDTTKGGSDRKPVALKPDQPAVSHKPGDIEISATTEGIDSGFNSVSGDLDAFLQTIANPKVLAQLTTGLDLPNLGEALAGGDFLQQFLASENASITSLILGLTGTLLGDSDTQIDPSEANIESLAMAIFEAFPGISEADVGEILLPVLGELVSDVDLPDFGSIAGDNDFFKVSFDNGPENAFIKSVTFDLTETLLDVSNAQFDPADADIDSLGLTIFDSFPEIGKLAGLDADDITFGDVQELDTVFDISFAPDAFGVGDYFTFGVDTNGVGSDFVPLFTLLDPLFSSPISGFNDTGADFGEAGVKFSVELWGDQTGESIFAQTGDLKSTAKVKLAGKPEQPASVPEPASIVGLLAVGAAIAGLKKQQQH